MRRTKRFTLGKTHSNTWSGETLSRLDLYHVVLDDHSRMYGLSDAYGLDEEIDILDGWLGDCSVVGM